MVAGSTIKTGIRWLIIMAAGGLIILQLLQFPCILPTELLTNGSRNSNSSAMKILKNDTAYKAIYGMISKSLDIFMGSK